MAGSSEPRGCHNAGPRTSEAHSGIGLELAIFPLVVVNSCASSVLTHCLKTFGECQEATGPKDRLRSQLSINCSARLCTVRSKLRYFAVQQGSKTVPALYDSTPRVTRRVSRTSGYLYISRQALRPFHAVCWGQVEVILRNRIAPKSCFLTKACHFCTNPNRARRDVSFSHSRRSAYLQGAVDGVLDFEPGVFGETDSLRIFRRFFTSRLAVASSASATGTRLSDTNKRQTQTRLSTFEQLPLDVLFEIFYLCHPHALLQLSRVSEGFRRTILDPKSARIWRTTLLNIDKLPFKPPNVSLPRFVHILFDDFCFVTLTRNCSIALQKMCETCLPVQFPNGDDLDEQCDLVKDKFVWLKSIIPSMPSNTSVVSYTTLKPSDELCDQLLLERQLRLKEKNEERYPIKKWLEAQAAQRAAARAEELKEIYHQRSLFIHHKLLSSNLGSTLAMSSDSLKILERRWIFQDTKLTEYGWDKIKDDVKCFMQESTIRSPLQEEDRAIRKRYELVASEYEAFLREQDFRAILPRFDDLAAMHDVQRLVNERPLGRDIEAEDIWAIFERRDFAQGKVWRNSCGAALVGLMSEALGTPVPAKDLKLATTHFSWKAPGACRELLGYPDVLDTHRVTRGVESYGANTVLDPWTAKYLRFDLTAHNRAEQLIMMAGEDPKTITAQELDDKNIWFEKRTAKTELQSERRVMRWREAVYSTRIRVTNLVLVNAKDAVRARHTLLRTEWKPDLSFCRRVQCTHCDAILTRQNSPDHELHIILHLQTRHRIKIPTPVDFEVDPFGTRPPGTVTIQSKSSRCAQDSRPMHESVAEHARHRANLPTF
ncbi:hypothetical protein FB107DRAFT_294352 [Schizophyllum commune]